MDNIIQILFFLPLFAFLVSGLLCHKIKPQVSVFFNSACLLISAVLSFIVFYDVVFLGNSYNISLFRWLAIDKVNIEWSIYVDVLSVLMLVIVNTVSALVHIYSYGYMSFNGIARFMSYLSLFTFFMLVLVTSNNVIQLFFGWEGVGLCSYLLIGYWYNKDSANHASLKAFWVNRISDLFFLIGIFSLYFVFGSFEFKDIFAQVSKYEAVGFTFANMQFHSLDFITMLLFLGCMGKSAQIIFHIWLPDAMEGPTPVSALIHAATMVTAGVFLVIRFSPVFAYSQFTLDFIAVVGAITCCFAAVIAIFQNDLKKIIAYSTCSQLGYMFFACGVSAYPAAMFHLGTHAFFKALLFLGAGSVIRALSGEQNIKRMGGIWNKIPFTYAMMIIGSLALVGIFPFAGYFSKDLILDAAYVNNTAFSEYAYSFGMITVFCTAVYSMRLLLFVFHGNQQTSVNNDKCLSMRISMFILSIGAVLSGAVGIYILKIASPDLSFWHNSITLKGTLSVMERVHDIPVLVKFMPLVISFLGLLITFIFYKFCVGFLERLKTQYSSVHSILVNKFYFDEIYNFVFVIPFQRFAMFLSNIAETKIIDGKGPKGVVAVVRFLSQYMSKYQSGLVYHYIAIMVLFLVIILSICLFMEIM